MVDAGISFPVGETGVYLVADGLYGSNSHEYEGDRTNLLAGFGGVELSFATEDRRRLRDTFPTLPE